MNERLQELLEQASEVHDYWYRGDSQRLVDHKMFAELIIQKCISQIALIGISNFENDDVMWATEKAIENIREHFGVKNEVK